jgi:hypothetical protein
MLGAKPGLDLSQGVAALWRGWEGGLSRGPYTGSEAKLNPRALRMPTMNVGMMADTGRAKCRGSR